MPVEFIGVISDAMGRIGSGLSASLEWMTQERRNEVIGNLSWIDWTIMVVAVVALRLVSLSTRHYMKGVSDFLSASRVAGRYLLTIAQQMGGFGVVTFIALFEMYWAAGLAPLWWAGFTIPIGSIILLTGWVYYRFRETRAMTMAQYLEMRYSRRLRIYAGILCWTSGILNFGIFPAVAARFFIYFCGLPDHTHLPYLAMSNGMHLAFTSWSVPSIAIVMLIDLALALSFVNMGGQISVMITECVQGMFCSFAFLVIIATILIKIHWPDMVHALQMAPKDASMLHPFHTSRVKDFNIFYYLVGVFGAFYSYMSWQGAQGFFSSARTPHEQKMGGIIGSWRNVPHALMTVLLALATITILKLPQFADTAHQVATALDKIPLAAVQGQMRVPITMAHFLPIGIKGLLATIFLFFSFTCHDTYMHSWGSIFVQDIILPVVEGARNTNRHIKILLCALIGAVIATGACMWLCRSNADAACYLGLIGGTLIATLATLIYALAHKPVDPARHIKLLRWAIVGVGAFAFIFSLVYKPTEQILFFFALTAIIWVGGSGAVIVGGLYWKRATTAAAFCALTVGAVLGIAGLTLKQFWPYYHHGDALPINEQYLLFFAMLSAALVYVFVSLVTSRRVGEFNLERMLHRGQYRIAADHVQTEFVQSRWLQIVGITKEFSKSDKVLAIAMIVWNATWFLWFIVFSIANLFFRIGDAAWARYFHVNIIIIPALISLPATIWFTVGGIHDIKALFRSLATLERDSSDDGRVVHHADDTIPPGGADQAAETLSSAN